MSFMIGFQSFRDRKVAKFDRSIAWNIFGPKAHLVAEGWKLTYEGGASGILYLDDDALVDGCSINRPSGPALRDLYELARLVPSAINADADFFVTDPAFIDGMPEWLLNVLPHPPWVMHSADEFMQYFI